MLSIINFFLIVFAYIIIFCIGLKKDTNDLKMDLSEMPDKLMKPQTESVKQLMKLVK